MEIHIPTNIFTYPDIALPRVARIMQRETVPALSEKQAAKLAAEAVNTLLEQHRLAPGASVAVGVGSRGICSLAAVVKAVLTTLQQAGLQPFVTPAMGSHGGATAEGQKEVLESYGVTEEAMGAAIRSSMEVEQVGELGREAGEYAGFPVYCDRNAYHADAILLVNRIKSHTDFSGPIESGIGKMAVIGLGKRHGADAIHRQGAHGLAKLLPLIARFQAERLPLLGGIALIENSAGRTCEIHPLPAAFIGQKEETSLLHRAAALLPRIPFKQLDVLLIDEIGKNISGACMDTHVIGRLCMPSLPESDWEGPSIRLIAALDLTEETHGNAVSMGLADLTTERLISRTNWESTLINARTSGEGGILRSRIPLILPTAEDCARTAIATCGRANSADVRLARIRSTAHTTLLEISPALLEEARANPQLQVDEELHAINLNCKLQ